MIKPIACLLGVLGGVYLVCVGWWPIGAVLIIAGAEYSQPKGKGSSHE